MQLVQMQTQMVDQTDIVNLITVRNRIKGLEAVAERLEAAIVRKLRAGAAVEPGTHDAFLAEHCKGRKIVQQLVVR